MISSRGSSSLTTSTSRDPAVTNLTEFFERFRRLNVRSSPELDALVEQARGLVKGVAVNHGGKVSTVTSPNPFAQSQVVVKAFQDAGISPASVNYIEAHGTGTPKGDPIEMNALMRDMVDVVAGAAHIDGAFDKMFCRLHDRGFPLRLLPPYVGMSEEIFERFAAVVREKYPRWVPD